jgi:hypothetical protein
MCRPWPALTELIRACSCGGGGAPDHAGHQRRSAVQGESQARIARSPCGQGGAGGGAVGGPPLSAAGPRFVVKMATNAATVQTSTNTPTMAARKIKNHPA